MPQVSVLSFGLMDIDGKTGTVVTYLPSGLTVAQIQAYVDQAAEHLDGVTAAQIVSAHVNLALTLPEGLKSAMGGQYIQLGANIGFQVDDSIYRYTQRIPAIRESLKSGDTVPLSAQAMIDYVGDMVTGVTPALPCDEDGGDLVDVIEATATFRKS